MGGKLLYGYGHSSVIDCLIIDRSHTGVRIETAEMTHVPERLFLRLGTQEPQPVRRVWAIGNMVGFEIGLFRSAVVPPSVV